MPKIRYLHKTRREMPGMYARNPSIILQNMNFSRYYRYRAQLIYSFDLNIIKFDISILAVFYICDYTYQVNILKCNLMTVLFIFMTLSNCII